MAGTATICADQSAMLVAVGADTYLWSTTATSTSITVAPTITTTYTLTGLSATNGCSKSVTKSIFVNSLPNIIITNSSPVCLGQTITLSAAGATTYTWNTAATTSTIMELPSGNTSYTVLGTGANGCSSYAIKSLTVNALPTVLVGSSSNTICSGQPVILSSSGANTYTWSTGAVTSSITVIPTIVTTYSVVGRDLNGCKGTDMVTIQVNSTPTLIVVSNSPLICQGQSALLSVSGADTYSWSTTANTSSITIFPTSSTVYSVTGTASNGCNKTASITQSVSVCTGIEATQEAASYNVYPNPFSTELNIEVEKPTLLTIVNVLGQVIYSVQLHANHNNVINTISFAAGIYYIELISDEKVVRKMIKE